MTWGPTHIALEAFLVWAGMGKKNREIFRAKRWVFALLSLFAIFPDLDTFIYLHRTYLHSIVWPLFLIFGVLIWLIITKYIQKKELGEKADLLSRSIIIIGVFIILHSILDLTTGPVLLFYPFDNRLYNLNAYMIWDLDSPFLLGGFHFEWTSVSLNEGIDTYFLNLAPEDRIQLFGSEFIYVYITDFPLHALTFFAWLVFFPLTALIEWTRKLPKPANFYSRIKKFKNPILTLGVLLLIFGLILGPALRLERIEEREYSTTLFFNENETNYGVVQKFELDENDALSLSSDFAGNNSQCTISAAIATDNQFTNLINYLDELFDQYNDEALPLSYEWLVANYQSAVNLFLSSALDYFDIIMNSSQEISYELEQKAILYSVILLADWNSTIDFSAQTQMVTTLSIMRTAEFYSGIALASLGVILTILPIIFTFINNSNEKPEEPREKNKEEQETADELPIRK